MGQVCDWCVYVSVVCVSGVRTLCVRVLGGVGVCECVGGQLSVGLFMCLYCPLTGCRGLPNIGQREVRSEPALTRPRDIRRHKVRLHTR